MSAWLTEPAERDFVPAMLTVDSAIDLFLARGFAERTRATYSRILDKFADRFPRDQDIGKVTEDDCIRFFATYQRRAVGTQAHVEAVLSSFFGWLYRNRRIRSNPMDRLPRTRRIPADDLDVTSLTPDQVRALLAEAGVGAKHPWTEKLAVAVTAYMGPRRRAVARLRLSDYDEERGLIRFREKGGKTIWKPVPGQLAGMIAAALADGAIERPDGYLIPPEGYLWRRGDRDDRVIWRVVKRVADRAGIDAHVHALRAAFACFFLEQNPGNVEALKELMGHRSLQTTQVYLRKMDKRTAMESVRSLAWLDNTGGDGSPLFAGSVFADRSVVGAGGFEPPNADSPAAIGQKPPTEAPGGSDDLAEALARRLPDPVATESADLA